MIYNGCEFIGASAMCIQKTVSLKFSTDSDLQSFFSLLPLLLWFLSLEGAVLNVNIRREKYLSASYSLHIDQLGGVCVRCRLPRGENSLHKG